MYIQMIFRIYESGRTCVVIVRQKEVETMGQRGKKIILILGMHRSGTSMVTELCQQMGVYLGSEKDLILPTEYNPDGHFENEKITVIDNKILHICNQTWFNLETAETDTKAEELLELKTRLKEIIISLFRKSNVIGIKDPRISVLLPFWGSLVSELGVDVDYIWVYRNPQEVAASLSRRDGFCEEYGLRLWSHYNLCILDFLKDKRYLLLNYQDILEHPYTLDKLQEILGEREELRLYEIFQKVVKPEYRHEVCQAAHTCRKNHALANRLYQTLCEGKEREIDMSELSRKFMMDEVHIESKYVDDEVMTDKAYLKDKKIVIYGAGAFGAEAAAMLCDLGFPEFAFCDRESSKHGTEYCGGKVYGIHGIEDWDNLLIIIAVRSESDRKSVEQNLSYIEGAKLLSFFALTKTWKFHHRGGSSVTFEIEKYSHWYQLMAYRAKAVMEASESRILVFQNGKVGSSSVHFGLKKAGIMNAHVHRFFFEKDINGELILGESRKDVIKESNIFRSLGYAEKIRDAIKPEKIITMVRDPIAVDLATVFQWLGNGIVDCYFVEQYQKEKSLLEIVTGLLYKVQNRMFEWFDGELKAFCGIDVFQYPFDREKGFTIIRENGVEVLLMKTERLLDLEDVVREFVHNENFRMPHENEGKNKEYSHLYEAVKKKLVLPQDYIDFYYKDNEKLRHFYTEDELEGMKRKWVRR